MIHNSQSQSTMRGVERGPGYGGQEYAPYPPPQYGGGPPPGPGAPTGGAPPPSGHYQTTQPYGYPPQSHLPSQYGYSSGYRPTAQEYSGGGGIGYSGGPYPTQQSQSPKKSEKGKKKSPVRREKQQRNIKSSSSVMSDSINLHHLDSGQEKNPMMEVIPMRSDFQFFVQNVRTKILADAELEVRETMDGDETKIEKMLVYSNFNTRLMRAWEDVEREERGRYMKREEDDWKRYILDDEVASRHCATLTARAKSPKTNQNDTDVDSDQDDDAVSVKKDEGVFFNETKDGEDNVNSIKEETPKRPSSRIDEGESLGKKAKTSLDHGSDDCREDDDGKNASE